MQRKLNGLRNLHWQVLFLSENGISRPDIIPRTQNSCVDHAAAAKKARIGFASLLFLLLLIPAKQHRDYPMVAIARHGLMLEAAPCPRLRCRRRQCSLLLLQWPRPRKLLRSEAPVPSDAKSGVRPAAAAATGGVAWHRACCLPLPRHSLPLLPTDPSETPSSRRTMTSTC
jgi:hypothetical protein